MQPSPDLQTVDVKVIFQRGSSSANTEDQGGPLEEIRTPGQTRSITGPKWAHTGRQGNPRRLPPCHQLTSCDFGKNPTSRLVKQMAKPSLRSLSSPTAFSLPSLKKSRQADTSEADIQRNFKKVPLVPGCWESFETAGGAGWAVQWREHRQEKFWLSLELYNAVPDHLPTL